MGVAISAQILGLKGQCVNQIQWQDSTRRIVIQCRRDRRRKAVDPLTGKKGTINRYIQRQVRDVPFCGRRCLIEIELAQVWVSKNERPYSLQTANPPKTTDNHWLSVKKYRKHYQCKDNECLLCGSATREFRPRIRTPISSWMH